MHLKEGEANEALKFGFDSLPDSLCDENIEKLVKTKVGRLTINLPFIRIWWFNLFAGDQPMRGEGKIIALVLVFKTLSTLLNPSQLLFQSQW